MAGTKMIDRIKYMEIIIAPFRWRWPLREVCVLDTAYICGPFRVVIDN